MLTCLNGTPMMAFKDLTFLVRSLNWLECLTHNGNSGPYLLVMSVNWLEWWTYDGISGPNFWGLINPDWAICNQVFL